ncbi:MAG: hypothetical protein LQ339_004234 [Xanthoria mediterranea]|nr:MAG: hypothetical protein LQ339_004234 [Xanthoria mediterranea]
MEGYPKLASLMGACPEVAILRRFGSLNARNLLYLQAELVALEETLRACTERNNASNDADRIRSARDWYTLSRLGNNGSNVGAGEEWWTMLEIRKKLKEYNAALVHQSLITGMSKPNPRDLAFLQEWMRRPSMGNVYLLGQDSDIWANPEESDLIALQARHSDSPVSRWMSDTLVHWYHQAIGRKLRKPKASDWTANTVIYSENGVTRLASVLGVFLSSLLPIASIVVLYYIGSDTIRLVVIALFTACFSISMCLVTSARVVDVFTATAAFTAVQVVFVGTNGPRNEGKV